LSNAFKFTPAGGSVTLSVLFNEGTEALSIMFKDNGIGMQPRELDRIFERFYQANNRNEKPVGSGIGLFIVKQYVDLQNGTITVSSEPGAGTCFTVTLPVGKAKAPIPQEAEQLTDKKRYY
jgi:signal transduction histidine kinase